MKKIFFLLTFLPLVSFGKFSKGTKLIGVAMSYTSSRDNSYGSNSPATTYFSFEGQLGFFLNEAVSIGPTIGAYANNYASINPITNLFETRKLSGLSGGIFARKFYKIIESLL